MEEQEQQSQKLQFPNINEALDWLEEHMWDAPPGNPVVVAGAAS